MTNKEKFIEIMNKTFHAGLTAENVVDDGCSPCGMFKLGACQEFTCEGCKTWWRKEYVTDEKM